MTSINSEGYLRVKKSKKDWWIVKQRDVSKTTCTGYVDLKRVTFSGLKIGKKVKFKVIEVEDE